MGVVFKPQAGKMILSPPAGLGERGGEGVGFPHPHGWGYTMAPPAEALFG